MPVLHLDFMEATEHNSASPSKIYPPAYKQLRNVKLTFNGVFRTRNGYENVSTNASPNVSGAVNAVAPSVLGTSNATTFDGYCLGGTTFYYLNLRTSAWTTSTVTDATDIYPYQYTWAYTTAKALCVVFAPVGSASGGKIYFAVSGGTNPTQMGSVDYASNPWTTGRCFAYFLNRGWVGAPDGVNDRVYYSITGDFEKYYGIGSGFLDLFPMGGSNYDMTGMCVYRNNLYFACGPALMALTGTTERTFGTRFVHAVNSINGATMLASDSLLFYQNMDGIWIFNGGTPLNVAIRDQADAWDALSINDRIDSSANIDLKEGIYRIFFPAANQLWEYWYRKNRWVINTLGTSPAIRCIGPVCAELEGAYSNFLLGAATNGRVFVSHDNTITDDGAAITCTAKTGDLMLGLIGGKPGYEANITNIWIMAVPDASSNYAVTMDMSVDGTALTQQSVTITSGAAAVPVRHTMPLPERTSALVHTFTFKVATSGVTCQVTDILIEYELERR